MTNQKSILVVDDEELTRRGIADILVKCRYDVFTAQNGGEAMTALEKKRYDLIITDMLMPGMTGIDLLRTVKTACRETGVIIITGYGEVDSYLESMNLGAYEYINKPVKVTELKRIVNNFFNHSVATRPESISEIPVRLDDLDWPV